jgi:hypothetical protein
MAIPPVLPTFPLNVIPCIQSFLLEIPTHQQVLDPEARVE